MVIFCSVENKYPPMTFTFTTMVISGSEMHTKFDACSFLAQLNEIFKISKTLSRNSLSIVQPRYLLMLESNRYHVLYNTRQDIAYNTRK